MYTSGWIAMIFAECEMSSYNSGVSVIIWKWLSVYWPIPVRSIRYSQIRFKHRFNPQEISHQQSITTQWSPCRDLYLSCYIRDLTPPLRSNSALFGSDLILQHFISWQVLWVSWDRPIQENMKILKAWTGLSLKSTRRMDGTWASMSMQRREDLLHPSYIQSSSGISSWRMWSPSTSPVISMAWCIR